MDILPDIENSDVFQAATQAKENLSKTKEMRDSLINAWIVKTIEADRKLGGELIREVPSEKLATFTPTKDRDIKKYYSIAGEGTAGGTEVIGFGFSSNEKPVLDIYVHRDGKSGIAQAVTDRNVAKLQEILDYRLNLIASVAKDQSDRTKLTSVPEAKVAS